MGDWDETEHPRNPDDGRFVEKAVGRIRAMFPDLTPTQERREDVLHALDPIGNYRRKLTQLYDILEIDPELARESIDAHLWPLGTGRDLPRPEWVLGLDPGLAEYAAGGIPTPEAARDLLRRLEAIQATLGFRSFDDTIEILQDRLDDYEGD